jgi:predicted nucleotidyltransferase
MPGSVLQYFLQRCPVTRCFIDSVKRAASLEAMVTCVALAKSSRMDGAATSDLAVYIEVDTERLALEWCRQFAESLGSLSLLTRRTDTTLSCLYRHPLVYVDLHFCNSSLLPFIPHELHPVWNRREQELPTNPAPGISGSSSPHPALSETIASCLLCVHTAIAKLHRGELFESIRKLNMSRALLAPLIAAVEGTRSGSGVRRFETRFPRWIAPLSTTIPLAYDPTSVMRALCALLELLKELEIKLIFTGHGQQGEIVEALASFAKTSTTEKVDNPSHEDSGPQVRRPNGRDVPGHMFRFLKSAARMLMSDDSVLGVAVGGSWLGPSATSEVGDLDAYSDLDVYVVVREKSLDRSAQLDLAKKLAPHFLVHRRTPNYLSALYRNPILRVDLRFVTVMEMSIRWEDPEVLWERGDVITSVLSATPPDPLQNRSAQPDLTWLQSNFWIGLLNCTNRLCRGELLQVISDIDWMRWTIIGPLVAILHGVPCRGTRLIEFRFPEVKSLMGGTVAGYGGSECWRALKALLESYEQLSAVLQPPEPCEAMDAVRELFVRSSVRFSMMRPVPSKSISRPALQVGHP